MKTYKFLTRGRLGPFSGVRWPAAGAWIEIEGRLDVCARGVHVCRPVDLAHWLHEELWETETDGEQLEGVDCVVVRRARLVRPIVAWSEGGAARFAEACIARAAAHVERIVDPDPVLGAILEDAREATSGGYFAIAAFNAAVVMARLHPASDLDRAYRSERARQSAWIARELLDVGGPAGPFD